MPQAWRLTRSSGEDKPYVNKPAPWSEDSQYFRAATKTLHHDFYAGRKAPLAAKARRLAMVRSLSPAPCFYRWQRLLKNGILNGLCGTDRETMRHKNFYILLFNALRGRLWILPGLFAHVTPARPTPLAGD
jgi:hypothetical protein